MTATATVSTGPVHELDARRAYYVFLTHVRKAHASGVRWPVRSVMEIGVGTSMGVGYCALLAGAGRYIGLDAVRHLDPGGDPALLDELRAMFQRRAPALNDAGKVAFEFPAYALPDASLDGDLMSRVTYEAPYGQHTADRFAGASDFLLSTATLEHVDDMAGGYAMFMQMLKPGGVMSHSIDFKSHGFGKQWNDTRPWNQHWLLTTDEWSALTAGKAYSINRLSCSQHLKLMLAAGFELLTVEKRYTDSALRWNDLAPEFQWLTDEDITCSGVHVIARRPGYLA
jgi:hypothetical protein